MTKAERLLLIKQRFDSLRMTEVVGEPHHQEDEGIVAPTDDDIHEEAIALSSFEEHKICKDKALTSDGI
jgi:hypothetical protein